MSKAGYRSVERRGPIVGITADLMEVSGSPRAVCGVRYAEAVARAGGVPVLLQPLPAMASAHLALCDAFVFTGGDDPRTEPFGEPTHAAAKPIDPVRQEYETLLLRELASSAPDTPLLGVCLGMQLLTLCAGGRLNQHLPDDWPTHELHRKGAHAVRPASSVRRDLDIPTGSVMSHHRQAVSDPGRLAVVAVAEDGLIEAVADPRRAFCLGVQWHPERTEDPSLGDGLFVRLVRAAVARGA